MTETDPGAAWKQRLTEEMTAEARELLGAGFVPDYYQSAAAGFVMIAEAAIGEALAEVERLTDRWTELRERAEKGRDTCTSMYLAARDEAECRRRLAGKLDGIKLVLSYMGDAERAGR